jgi:hypothetical protein
MNAKVKTHKTNRDKATENYERYQYAKERGHTDYIKKHDQCNDFFFSEQWDSETKKKLQAADRPALTINRIKPVIKDMTGEFINNRADVKFVPSVSGEAETADALTKLYMHVSEEQEFTQKELDLWLDGIITSRAYYDVRIGFDDNLMGEIRVAVPNPKNILPDPDSDSRNPDDWNDVIITSHLSIQDIEILYGETKAKEVKQFPNVDNDYDIEDMHRDTFAGPEFTTHHSTHGIGDETTQRLYHVIERQYRSMEPVPYFVNTVTGDVRRVPPEWTDEDQAAVLQAAGGEVEIQSLKRQVIRWTVSCGDILLHDDISPYDCFTIVPWFPVFRRGRSAGVVEDLIDPQLNYNKQRSQELHIVNGTANSGWKVKRGSLTNMDTEDLETYGAKSGIVLEFADNPDDIDRIQPVNIPQGIDRVSEKADRDIRSISGIDEESRGVTRGNTPGKAIEARREAALVSMTTLFESLAFTRKLLAKRVLKLLQKFYTEERHLRILGNPIRGEVEDLAINEPQEDGSIRNDITLGEYGVIITPAPQRDSYEQMQFEQLKQMQVELGIKVPAHLFIEFSDLGRKPEIAQEIKKANGLMEPSEQQIELQRMQESLDLEEKKASIEARMAQAQLSRARAQKVLQEIETAGDDPEKIEKLLLEARRIDMERWNNEEAMEVRRRAQAVDEAKAVSEDDLSRRELDLKLAEYRDRKNSPQTAEESSNGNSQQ